MVFNSGRGSGLTRKGTVEMEYSIMDGLGRRCQEPRLPRPPRHAALPQFLPRTPSMAPRTWAANRSFPFISLVHQISNTGESFVNKKCGIHIYFSVSLIQYALLNLQIGFGLRNIESGTKILLQQNQESCLFLIESFLVPISTLFSYFKYSRIIIEETTTVRLCFMNKSHVKIFFLLNFELSSCAL